MLGQVLLEFIYIDCGSLGRNNHGQWAFLPAGVRYGNHSSLTDSRMIHEGTLEVDGADPLSSRLDDILGPINNPDVGFFVKGDNISRAEPAVVRPAGL